MVMLCWSQHHKDNVQQRVGMPPAEHCLYVLGSTLDVMSNLYITLDLLCHQPWPQLLAPTLTTALQLISSHCHQWLCAGHIYI